MKAIKDTILIHSPLVERGILTGFTAFDENTGGLSRGELTVIAGQRGLGKAQPLSSLVLTPQGFKTMGNVQAGDIVYGKAGNKETVIGVFPQGKRPVYSITFSDNSIVDCDENHLWEVATLDSRLYNKSKRYIKSTKELLKNYKRGKRRDNNYSVDRCDKVEFDRQEQIIPAWLLGFYLGDGWTSGSCPKFTITQPEILKKIQKLLPKEDTIIKATKIDYRVKRRHGNNKVSSLYMGLVQLGLNGKRSFEKFIPTVYLVGDIRQREEILLGLLDSGGYKVDDDWYEYSTTSERLANDVKFLVKSLGGHCTIGERDGKYKINGEYINTRKNYRVYIRLKPIRPLYITNIEFKGEEECQCILVDHPQHLYLTNEFIPTHNTSLAIDLAIKFSKTLRVAFFSMEMAEQQLLTRMCGYIQESKYLDLVQGKIPVTDETRQELAKLNLFICEKSGISPMQAEAVLDESKQEYDVIIFDHIGCFRTTGFKGQRYEAIDRIAEYLKTMSKNRNAAVIALCHLNRESEKRDNHKPRLSDCREGAGLENFGNKIILLYRPAFYNLYEERKQGNYDDSEMYFILAKNTNGETGEFPVCWIGETMRYKDVKFDLGDF